MEMRPATHVTRGYFFLLGASRLVDAVAPRTVRLDSKKIFSGTQGNSTVKRTNEICLQNINLLISAWNGQIKEKFTYAVKLTYAVFQW